MHTGMLAVGGPSPAEEEEVGRRREHDYDGHDVLLLLLAGQPQPGHAQHAEAGEQEHDARRRRHLRRANSALESIASTAPDMKALSQVEPLHLIDS